MTWWDKFKDIVKSEAADAKEGLAKLGKTLDEELARKEREQAATPSERIDMLLEGVEEEDARFQELEEKVKSVGARDKPIDDRSRMFADSDVSKSPMLAVAIGWVEVITTPLDPDAVSGFDHDVTIDGAVGTLIGEEALDAAVTTVQDHPLVLDVRREGSGVSIHAPALHGDDVRAIVAAAFADQIPTDWEQRLHG